jgi:hypothetical protein
MEMENGGSNRGEGEKNFPLLKNKTILLCVIKI